MICTMTTTSISQLKINPSAIIAQAIDYPVAVSNHNDVQAYIIGKSLFEKMVIFIEDHADNVAVKKTDFAKGIDFEKVANELGI